MITAATKTRAQTPILIPDTLSGNIINLTLAEGSTQFYVGQSTKTFGFNGSYLEPTLVLRQVQKVTLNVRNNLTDTTTTHWQGLHVAAIKDGSPHNPIVSGSTWSPYFSVLDKAIGKLIKDQFVSAISDSFKLTIENRSLAQMVSSIGILIEGQIQKIKLIKNLKT